MLPRALLCCAMLAGCGEVANDVVDRLDAAAPPPDALVVIDAAAPDDTVVDRSCADVKARLATTVDAVYWIDPDLDGDALQPFTVFCGGMNTPTPVAYLELAQVSDRDAASTANFAGYVTGPTCPCGTLELQFHKVALDVATMTLQRESPFSVFSAASDVACTRTAACRNPQFYWYGAAGSCANINDASGRSNIDLRGTPFHVHPDQGFAAMPEPQGYMSNGAVAIDANRKQVALSGGGHCGGFGSFDGVRLVQDR